MTWWHYLLLSNLYLILFFGFYALLLQRETFFQLNRVYLVGSALLSFFIPVIHLDVVQSWFITQKVHQTIYNGSADAVYVFNAQPDRLTLGEVAGMIYIAGIIILTFKLVWQLSALSQIIKSDQIAAPWSFFGKIKVDESIQGQDAIIAHENVHAKQWHSADVLLIEILMIINWFNPVMYLYRRFIKQTHEFIADRDAIKAGTGKAEYAMLLLNQTFNNPAHHLLNPFFSNSVLKERIKMLQKNKSGYTALIKYGFSAPLFALMLALSSATINNSKVVKKIQSEALEVFDAPANIISGTPVQIEELTVKKPQQEELTANTPAFKMNDNMLVKDEPVSHELASSTTDSAKTSENSEVFTSVEKLPNFVGGVSGFITFLRQNLRNPNNQQGRVNVTFIVKKDGNLANVQALRVTDPALAAEAIRVVSASPRWIPGEQNGHKVNVQYTVPVMFVNSNESGADTTKRVQSITFHKFSNVRTASATFDSTKTMASAATERAMVYAFNGTAGGKSPHFIIDGKDVTVDKVKALDAKNIEKIQVFKTEESAKQFGVKYDQNGVVAITTVKRQ
ncbi:M56 family metallopeptidase [Mucilaginibacter aquatilis]|uniref:TonB family protein n=1 Tax=Mucilaginibacter aquatilis TaxID=1517760 RepID=A0A6I4IEA8_9SPHI|nr:M56 family metallopeptidase [Mucilaginibacter aquatilis]MVN92128.1 hypothetical protein [Mucilaginibacter aquatilis]